MYATVTDEFDLDVRISTGSDLGEVSARTDTDSCVIAGAGGSCAVSCNGSCENTCDTCGSCNVTQCDTCGSCGNVTCRNCA